jgi:exonuclease VII small subunit
MLGERENGTARLEEAVEAFRAALQEQRRERVPLDWAETQGNLGSALRMIGERESGITWLEEALRAFESAVNVYREADLRQHESYFDDQMRSIRQLIAQRQGDAVH